VFCKSNIIKQQMKGFSKKINCVVLFSVTHSLFFSDFNLSSSICI